MFDGRAGDVSGSSSRRLYAFRGDNSRLQQSAMLHEGGATLSPFRPEIILPSDNRRTAARRRRHYADNREKIKIIAVCSHLSSFHTPAHPCFPPSAHASFICPQSRLHSVKCTVDSAGKAFFRIASYFPHCFGRVSKLFPRKLLKLLRLWSLPC